MKKLIVIMCVMLLSVTGFAQLKAEFGIKVGRGADLFTISKIAIQGDYFTMYNGSKPVKPAISDSINLLAIPIVPLIYSAAGDTSNYPVPGKIGNLFINTSAGKVYISKAATRNGWVILN